LIVPESNGIVTLSYDVGIRVFYYVGVTGVGTYGLLLFKAL